MSKTEIAQEIYTILNPKLLIIRVLSDKSDVLKRHGHVLKIVF